MMTELSYLIYLGIAVPLTLWMASTIRQYGRVFLIDVFHGDEKSADAVGRLLVLGFYLVNLGFVVLFLRTLGVVPDVQTMVEKLSVRIGVMLVVLGFLHLFNVWVVNAMRNRTIEEDAQSAGPLTGTKPPMLSGY